MITNPVKCAVKLHIPSQTSTVQSFKFGNGQVIYPTLYNGYWYLSMSGIKLIRVSKKPHDLRMGIVGDYCVCGEISNIYI